MSPSQAPAAGSTRPEVIFFGNGPLAVSTLATLEQHCKILFHAHAKEDLATAAEIKKAHPHAFGILASFGVMIKPAFLKLFEPEGILNLHPSKLPLYRGASPIESAILHGDQDFSYSIMKLVRAMDAGPIYHQATLKNLPLDKVSIYHALATAGAQWLNDNLAHIRQLTPIPQDDSAATFTEKLDKAMSYLEPQKYPAATIFRQIVAYQGYPKPKYTFFGKVCIILEARLLRVTDILCEAAGLNGQSSPLMIKCADRNFVVIDKLQPEGKRPMDAKSFYNGYAKNQNN